MKRCRHANVVRLVEIIDDASAEKIYISGYFHPPPIYVKCLIIDKTISHGISRRRANPVANRMEKTPFDLVANSQDYERRTSGPGIP